MFPDEVKFYVLHDGHEGSHGVGDKLIQIRCVNFLAGEIFDIHAANGIENARQQLALLRTFFETPLVTEMNYSSSLSRMRAKNFGEEKKMLHENCSCKARGMLLRADTATLCNLHGIKPYILVRTDLMRWSLSRYSSDIVLKHPQFNNDTLPMHKFSITRLRNTANSMISKWRVKADLYTNLTRCGLNPRLIIYEAFEDTQQLPHRFVRELLPREHEEPELQKYNSVRIVHSHHISNFVENADEVYAHFIAMRYPTFADVFTQQASLTASELMDLVCT